MTSNCIFLTKSLDFFVAFMCVIHVCIKIGVNFSCDFTGKKKKHIDGFEAWVHDDVFSVSKTSLKIQ